MLAYRAVPVSSLPYLYGMCLSEWTVDYFTECTFWTVQSQRCRRCESSFPLPSGNCQVLCLDGERAFRVALIFSRPSAPRFGERFWERVACCNRWRDLRDWSPGRPWAWHCTDLRWWRRGSDSREYYFGESYDGSEGREVLVHFGFIVELWELADGLL